MVMKRGLGGINRKDLTVKIRQAQLRRVQLRQAMAQGSGQVREGVGNAREKGLLRAQHAVLARTEQLRQALKNASQAEERIIELEHGKGGHGATARHGAGEISIKRLERARKAIEARKERLDRMLRNQKEIESALRQKLQDSGAQVLSLYDPTEITVEQEELAAAGEGKEDEDIGHGGGSGGGHHAAKSGKRASKKSRKGHA
jgi:hypothetical protein